MSALQNVYFSSTDDSDNEDPPRRKKIYKVRTNFTRNVSDFQFKERFRMDTEELEFVLSKIGSHLAHKTEKNKALSPEQQLLMALHWMGNGGQYHGVADMHNVAKSTVCRAVKKVVKAVVSEMTEEVIAWPSDTSQIAVNFHKLAGFPSVGGCCDGTLFETDGSGDEAALVDRHGNHSINALMVCGPDQIIYYCSSRWPGSVHDSRVMRNSSLAERFEEGWRPFPGAVILGDTAYGVKEWLMPPVYNNPEDPAEQNYNSAHSSTRRVVECMYGNLKEKFPCLNYMRLKSEFAGMVILACATLFNVIKRDDLTFNPMDYVPSNGHNPGVPTEAPTAAGKQRQNELLAYFA